MSRPGVEVISRALPLPRTPPTDTSVLFAVGAVATDPGAPTLVRSLTDYVAAFGARTGGAALYDALDAYFNEGGAQAWVSGVVASSPTITELQPALDALTKDYGPGQLIAPELFDAAGHSAMLAHAAAMNRVALLDIDPTLDVTDSTALISLGTALQGDANAQYGALFAPSAVIPGIAGGTTRTIGYAAIEAGIIARNDPTFGPNVAAAGINGISAYALDLSARFSDADYESLNDAGVDMARVLYGQVETYGYRSLADPTTLAQWLEFNWARLNMAIFAEADAIGQRYVFAQLDGQGRTIASFAGDLAAMLAVFYAEGALYGAGATDAYSVNTGPSVNTPTTIANGELLAVLEVRMSPFAELVQIQIVKVSTTQTVAPQSAASIAA